ncbi:MAG: phenylalanine--tRNA ligase subunit beta [Candidatus Aenigmarchaeota archaeon]|nr:phenylalanine--tRNA ligase subunit beta [Candidatus Aenigmarchaeota archaeon]
MPTIEISYKDMCRLLEQKVPIDKLEELLVYSKVEIDGIEEKNGDKIFKLDVKDTNRPDLWSAEGIAREIKARLKKRGVWKCKVGRSKFKIIVDNKTKNVRPKIVAAIARDLKVDRYVLEQIIQLQEKIATSFGRNRREVAIGIYDLDKIKSPIKYTVVGPREVKFVPLDFNEPMTPEEILKKHPKGIEYGHLLSNKYPLLIDSAENVLSMPPIINSEYVGKVTEKTRNVFIECTGFGERFLVPSLNAVVAALADRGAKIESVEIVSEKKRTITPNLEPKRTVLHIERVNEISGLNLKDREIFSLLKASGYDIKRKGKKLDLLYPAFRQDIMHEVDIIEDIIISYGYNKIKPTIPKIVTRGSEQPIEEFSYKVAEVMIGLGMQEVMSYILTNKDNLFKKMNLPEGSVAEIENPMSQNWNVFRSWLLPSLMEFLSKNQHREFPQKVFEIGDCVILDQKVETKVRNMRKLAAVVTDYSVGYETISSILDALLRSLGIKYSLKKTTHKSFIEERVASILANGKEIGFVGEIHPSVLEKWKIETPVVGFEINLEKIFKLS